VTDRGHDSLSTTEWWAFARHGDYVTSECPNQAQPKQMQNKKFMAAQADAWTAGVTLQAASVRAVPGTGPAGAT
jgi:hypothetical protein